MYQSKVRNMIVIDRGVVLGLVNIRELSDVIFNVTESGSKTHIYRNLVGRRWNMPSDWTLVPCNNVSAYLSEQHYSNSGVDSDGVGDASNTTANTPTPTNSTNSTTTSTNTSSTSTNTSTSTSGLHMSVGASILPHPFKRHDKSGVVARNRRDYGLGKELALDLGLCEGKLKLKLKLVHCTCSVVVYYI